MGRGTTTMAERARASTQHHDLDLESAGLHVLADAAAAGAAKVIADLSVRRVGQATGACALSLVTHDDRPTPDPVRGETVHPTIEFHRCPAA